MLAVIITIVLSPGLDHTPGVLGEGLFPFFPLFKSHALFQVASEGNCAVKMTSCVGSGHFHSLCLLVPVNFAVPS